MRAALDEAMLSTDLADYLVRRGVPFREAHHISGRIVRRAEDRAVPLSELTLDDFKAESDVFEEDVFAVFDFDESVARRAVVGGTAPNAVVEQIEAARVCLSSRQTD